MPTVYQRLEAYCYDESKPMLTQKQKVILGRKIAYQFRQLQTPPEVYYKTMTENDGQYRVAIYPESFTQQLDELIKKYYRIITDPPKRKRKKVAVFTTRKSFNNNPLNVRHEKEKKSPDTATPLG